MRTPIIVSVATLALGVCATAAAQQHIENPHGKLQEECAVCHSAETWTPAQVSDKFVHAKYGFALRGAHAQATCRSCHASLDFHGASSDCVSCHKDIHHGELGTNCADCHTARNFLDRAIMARAHQLTRFPLSGAHLTIDCEACHTPMPQGRLTFVNLPMQCIECHQTQFQTAKNPDHVAGGFPQDCSQCHAQTIWTSARFNHDATGFPLTGAHTAVACAQCHTGGTFTALSTTCVSCHLPNYNSTTNPAHAAAGFPTTCEGCHTTTAWTGATFNHTWFKLPHASAQCSDCHTASANYATFTCTICHTQTQTTSQHQGVSGFVWNSTNCYSCHHGGGG